MCLNLPSAPDIAPEKAATRGSIPAGGGEASPIDGFGKASENAATRGSIPEGFGAASSMCALASALGDEFWAARFQDRQAWFRPDPSDVSSVEVAKEGVGGCSYDDHFMPYEY